MNRALSMLVLSALALGLASCGYFGPGTSASVAKLQRTWAPWMGEPLAREIALAWEPAFAAQAQADAAVAARDFAAYCSAMRSLRARYADGASATKFRLERGEDQTWRRRLLRFTGGDDDSTEEPRVRMWDLTRDLPTTAERSDGDAQWIRAQCAEHPREAGELARVVFGMKVDDLDLQRYFGLALSMSIAESARKAYDGFMNPGEPAKQGAPAQ